MNRVWHFYLNKGWTATRRKFRLDKGELRQVKRHFDEGLGEHEKYRRVRKFVGSKFKEVS